MELHSRWLPHPSHVPKSHREVERHTALDMEARGWEVTPNGKAKRLGKLAVIHGDELSGPGGYTSMYPSKRAVEVYGCSVLAGHTHAPQSLL